MEERRKGRDLVKKNKINHTDVSYVNGWIWLIHKKIKRDIFEIFSCYFM